MLDNIFITPGSVSNTSSESDDYQMTLSPVPNEGLLNFTLLSPIGQKATLKISSIDGSSQIYRELYVHQGENKLPTNFEFLKPGIYLFTAIFHDTGKTQTKKFIRL